MKAATGSVRSAVWAFVCASIATASPAVRAESFIEQCCEMSETCCDTSSWFDYGCGSRFRLAEINIYPTFSYRGADSATYNEFEFASFTDIGCWEMENRTVLNVADLPSTIKLGPTNPGGQPTTRGIRASGFGDVLSGFFFGSSAETVGRFRPFGCSQSSPSGI